MMNWKGFGRKRPWPDFKVLSRNSPGGTEEKNEKTLIRIAGRLGRDMNPRSPENKGGVLTARPRRSACCFEGLLFLTQLSATTQKATPIITDVLETKF
jgi:hypothetical protein